MMGKEADPALVANMRRNQVTLCPMGHSVSSEPEEPPTETTKQASPSFDCVCKLSQCGVLSVLKIKSLIQK